MTPFSIQLPQEPVDGYEVRYFRAEEYSVAAVRLKYHKNSKWGGVCDEGRGADFVDQWQVFVNGWFKGRLDGWARPITMDLKNVFERREDAADAVKADLEGRAQQYEERAQELRARIPRVA